MQYQFKLLKNWFKKFDSYKEKSILHGPEIQKQFDEKEYKQEDTSMVRIILHMQLKKTSSESKVLRSYRYVLHPFEKCINTYADVFKKFSFLINIFSDTDDSQFQRIKKGDGRIGESL